MLKRINWRWLLSWRSLTMAVLLAGVGTGAFFLGRNGGLSQATAQPPMAGQGVGAGPGTQLPGAPAPSAAYAKGVVAYIYGTVPVTKEELGEYLIARFGTDRLEPFINKKIIEYHCTRQGITVTAAEIEAETVKNLQTDPKTFADKILKARGKTLYEWKEDVVRPKLLMSKLCRDRVKVEEEDLQKAYQAYHGEKVAVEMILWPMSEHHIALKRWDEIRKDEKAFAQAARTQASRELASGGGRVNPFGRHTTGSPELEKMAFDKLEIGEVSPIIQTPQGYVVIKLLGKFPPEKVVNLEDVRAKLEKEIIEKKIQLQIPVAFAEMKRQADQRLLLKKYENAETLTRDVERELGAPDSGSLLEGASRFPAPPLPPLPRGGTK